MQIRPVMTEVPPTRKLVKWLEHGAALRDGVIDWKRQYRIRKNWDSGAAQFQEVEVAEPPTPPVLARVHKGLIFTVDAQSGLRAWSQKDSRKQLLSQTSAEDGVYPFSLSVDGSAAGATVAVGYGNGSFRLYGFDQEIGFQRFVDFESTNKSAMVSTVLAMPYLLTMTSDKHIYLYQILGPTGTFTGGWSVVTLTTLHADAPLQPAALSLRCTSTTIIATVSYAFNQLNSGWCLGLQEIRLSMKGGLVGSRLTSTIETPMDARYRGRNQWDVSSRSATSTPLSTPFALNPLLKSPPTSLSHSHPFLLASLPDNTIMSYVVTSDDQKLEISTGKRLWGHTSAISGAEVSNRGKAVSVSAKGEEIRVWELEETLTTPGRGRASTEIKPRSGALNVAAAIARRGSGVGIALNEMRRELALTRRWVGFDEEQVVVMGERNQRQIMACYDFT